MEYCTCNPDILKKSGFSIIDGKATCNSCGKLDLSENSSESSQNRDGENHHQNGDVFDYPTDQIQQLIVEFSKANKTIKRLQFSIGIGFSLLFFYLAIKGVKVNLSPTLFSPIP